MISASSKQGRSSLLIFQQSILKQTWEITELMDVMSAAPQGTFLGQTLFTLFIYNVKSDHCNGSY